MGGDVVGWAGVGVLAALGALARFAIDDAVQRRSPWRLPIGILAVNVSGSFALGVLAGAGASGWTLRLAGAALLGSYTTFSTWMLDSQQLAARANLRGSVLNVVGSVALGLAAVALGWAVGSAL
jgi:fluoride exporter